MLPALPFTIFTTLSSVGHGWINVDKGISRSFITSQRWVFQKMVWTVKYFCGGGSRGEGLRRATAPPPPPPPPSPPPLPTHFIYVFCIEIVEPIHLRDYGCSTMVLAPKMLFSPPTRPPTPHRPPPPPPTRKILDPPMVLMGIFYKRLLSDEFT